MAKVYHATKPTFTKQNFPEDYHLVVEIDSDDLGDVFYLTNTIDEPWYEKFNIKPCRSTSVGDIVEINNKFYVCENLGWSEL